MNIHVAWWKFTGFCFKIAQHERKQHEVTFHLASWHFLWSGLATFGSGGRYIRDLPGDTIFWRYYGGGWLLSDVYGKLGLFQQRNLVDLPVGIAGAETGLADPGPCTWYGASWVLGRVCNERQAPERLMDTWSGFTWGSLCNSACT